MSNHELVGEIGEADALDLLRSTFPQAEISCEHRDKGTDYFVKIGATIGYRYRTVEWRIQVKATTQRGRPSVRLSKRRARNVYDIAGRWFALIVHYGLPEKDIVCLNAAERSQYCSIYMVDMRIYLDHLMAADKSILSDNEKPIHIRCSDHNLVNRYTLTHLWAACVWDQPAAAIYGKGVEIEHAEQVKQLNVAIQAMQNKERSLPPLPNLDGLLTSLDGGSDQTVRTPLYSLYGAHNTISHVLDRQRGHEEVRGFSRLAHMEHVLCWMFSSWYEMFNQVTHACSNGTIRRALHVGGLKVREDHERVTAWQMIRVQIGSGIVIYLTSDPKLDAIESETLLLPDWRSATRLYDAGQVLDHSFEVYRPSADPVPWASIWEESPRIVRVDDLYSKEVLEIFDIRVDGHGEMMRPLGRPSMLFPSWWASTPACRYILPSQS